MSRFATCFLLLSICPMLSAQEQESVSVEIIEGIPDKKSWDLPIPKVTRHYHVTAFGIVDVPEKYSTKAHVLDRTNPYLLRAHGSITLPKGTYRFLLRARGAARLYLNDNLLTQTKFRRGGGNAHEKVPERKVKKEKGLYPLPIAHQQSIVTVDVPAGEHQVRLEMIVGGQKTRNKVGELVAGIAKGNEPFQLLSPDVRIPLSAESWRVYTHDSQARLREINRQQRITVSEPERAYWKKRHAIAKAIQEKKPAINVPDVTDQMPVHNDIDRFIGHRLEELKITPAPLTDDLAFLRRVTLDTVGTVPTRDEIAIFLKDAPNRRRANAIHRLLKDDRWADHWVSYWQDVLAENPGILKPMLNNTGPFRWWIHQAMMDNVSIDRFASELIMMEGSKLGGAPSGFGIASQNDVPMAAKAHVLGRAFLGVELACARCHDAPHHPFLQRDTFELAAMLSKKSLKVPTSSSVKATELVRRPLIRVTLKPGSTVAPKWPFPNLATPKLPQGILRTKNDPRENLAALITSPGNERFAQMIVNRIWHRYLGEGIVNPVDDWTNEEPSHPELLKYLAHELVTHDYNLKHVARLILNSHTYQRAILAGAKRSLDAEDRTFASPLRRRMTAEQIVDSLFVIAGKTMDCEELTLDPEARRATKTMLNLGYPQRAWEFTSLSNERDRPALALPVAQSIVDLLKAYGWRASRPNPITMRDDTPTPLQPMVLANGIVGSRITRLSDDSAFTHLSLRDQELTDLVDEVFLRVLTREPTSGEQKLFVEMLGENYVDRRPKDWKSIPIQRRPPRVNAVSWANHLNPEATKIKLQIEKMVREGDPATKRLREDWRLRMEDVIWVLINTPEFVFVP